MKAVIAGCGFIAGTHIEALRRLGAEITWAVGRNEDRTRIFAEKYGIPAWTTNLAEALESDADFVHICTPPPEHGSLIRACLEAGKNIICEKPLSISSAEAAELAELAKESGLITAVCCNVRYYPANIEAAKRLKAGGAGRMFTVSGSYFQEFHIPPHPDGWRFDAERSGGQRAISEIGTHWIDLAYAWTGKKITAVTAIAGNWYPVRYRADGMLTEGPEGEPVRVDTEDAAAVLLEFEDGAIGTLMLSEVSPGHPNDLSIEVSGSLGTIKWEEASPSVLISSSEGSMTAEDMGDIAREDTFLSLFRDVYAAAAGLEHGSYPDFGDGAYTARVCEAVSESCRTGNRVVV